MKIVECYKCETCEAIYEVQASAKECEALHKKVDNIVFSKFIFNNNSKDEYASGNDGYPDKIVITDDSGNGASYTLEHVDSIEHFFSG